MLAFLKIKTGLILSGLLLCVFSSFGQTKVIGKNERQLNTTTLDSISKEKKMKVEIWSDIMCPFCYIGKRNFENALDKFADGENIEVEWKSFQLDPEIPQDFDQEVNVYQYLANRKGLSIEQSMVMHERVKNMAKDVGLIYDFDKAVVANSFNAHRMIQMAKSKNLGDAAEERLFRAYFMEGKNFGKPEVLVQLGTDIGLSSAEVMEALSNNLYAEHVNRDIHEAEIIGVTGVPFFVFDRKYAVSGAQLPEAFLQTLQRAYGEWKMSKPEIQIEITDGPACTPEGKCD